MVSLRFPFSFPPPAKPPRASHHPFYASTAAFAAVTAVVAAGVAISKKTTIQEHPFLQNALNFFSNISPHNHSFPMWGSLSLAHNNSPVVESRTGSSFPAILGNSRRLLGIGLRKKSVLGLKNIDVYAFGVYADDSDVQKLLSEKYGTLSISEPKDYKDLSEDLMEGDYKDLSEDLMEGDIGMTVRLQIVYGRLSIRSVRSAFEDSIGHRLLKFGGSDNKELLQRFTSQFKDEHKIPQGSVIELSRECSYVLRTTIDGKEVGEIQSKLLCRSVLDLYIGEDPFDRKAKQDIELNLASLLQS